MVTKFEEAVVDKVSRNISFTLEDRDSENILHLSSDSGRLFSRNDERLR